MKKFILWVLFLVPTCVFSQFRDDFSDKKLTGRIVNWTGNIENFIVNPELQLQLNAPKENGKSFLATTSSLSENTVWECWIKFGFNPSSSNYAKIYLTSNSGELNESTGSLFVRIGHTNKNFCLIMNDGNSEKVLITGLKDRLNKSSFSFKMKVLFSKKGRLELYSKLDEETDYTLEGNTLIEKSIRSSHFGLLCQYTSTRSTLFYFDNIEVREMSEDENKFCDQKYGDDQQGEIPEPSDIVFNEIMFNAPSESQEYIELYNRSKKSLDLKYLNLTTRKSDGSLNKSYPITVNTIILEPEEYVVISRNIDAVCSYFPCRSSSLMIEMSSTPILNNTGGDLVLTNNYNNEEIIDEFVYSEKMHSEAIKDKKGVSLERINPDKETNNPDNWTSATALSGFGTPGYINSQYLKNPNTGTGNELYIIYPEFHLGNNQYEIRYHFDKPGNRCRILLFDIMGRMINQIANNELLGMEGSLYFYNNDGSGKRLQSGIHIIYAEIYSDDGKIKRHKIPVIIK
ncbi:MAG: lamin tail domain-containing protein [Dysgonamonadaceae bacterium]|jgi:hypothetical protein|nr:lamin tail domain-containing protein [Dysgonamonadaceae bacterium]